MTRLKEKVTRLEEARRRRRGAEPYEIATPDGRVTAKIQPHPGRLPSAIVRCDPWMEPDEAEAAIAPLLPPVGFMLVLPEALGTEEEWDRWVSQTGLRQRWQETQNPTLY